MQESVGEMIGDEEMAAEGKAKNREGEIQEKVGDIKKVFGQ